MTITCKVEACQIEIETGFDFYCYKHQCNYPDCTYKRQVTGMYCRDHICGYQGCQNRQDQCKCYMTLCRVEACYEKVIDPIIFEEGKERLGIFYCKDHKCPIPDCPFPTIMGDYCKIHTCRTFSDDCCNPAENSKFCEEHTCPNCQLEKDEYSTICDRCHCSVWSCGKEGIPGKRVCSVHKCSVDTCYSIRYWEFSKCEEHLEEHTVTKIENGNKVKIIEENGVKMVIKNFFITE